MVVVKELKGKPSRETAMKFEKQAREKGYASVFSIKTQYDKYSGRSAGLYERAGDEWVRQLPQEKNIGGVTSALRYAIGDYKSASKKAQAPSDIDRLYKKIHSVNRKLTELQQRGGLQRRLYGFFSITALAFALFFVGFNLTGNVIGGINLNDSRLIGLAFFIFGLVFAFVYLRQKV